MATQFSHAYKRNGLKGVFRCILGHLPQGFSYRLLFRKNYHRPVNSKNPSIFDEKLLLIYLKHFCHNPLVTKCADKVLVKDYIKEKIGEDILNKTIGVYSDPNEIVWADLPEAFAIKCNHGCGYNIIVPDKSKADELLVKKKLSYWLEENYGIISSEWQYKDIKPRIIIEDFLSTAEGKFPTDYKFMCANGKVLYCMLVIDREQTPKRACVDRNFNDLHYVTEDILENVDRYKPDSYEEMWRIAERLCKEFIAVRVDLYDVDGKVVFGELTFTSNGFYNHFLSQEAQEAIGSQITIE